MREVTNRDVLTEGREERGEGKPSSQLAQNVRAWKQPEGHLGQPPILQTRRLRHREGKWPISSRFGAWTQAHFLYCRGLRMEVHPNPGGWDSNPSHSLSLKPHLWMIILSTENALLRNSLFSPHPPDLVLLAFSFQRNIFY